MLCVETPKGMSYLKIKIKLWTDYKVTDKVFFVHATKAYRGTNRIVPVIHNLNCRWRLVAGFTSPRPNYPREKKTCVNYLSMKHRQTHNYKSDKKNYLFRP